MPRWTQPTGAERARQSQAAKRAMLERARSTPEAVRTRRWHELNAVPVFNPPQLYSAGGYATTATHTADIMAGITSNIMDNNAAWHSTASPPDWTSAASIWQDVTNYYRQYMPQWRSSDWAANTTWHYAVGTDLIPPLSLSPEEADRRLAATREIAHKSAIRRQKAVKKGRKLLLEVLSEAQKQEYARTKSFTVVGANGKTYKLRKGRTTHEVDESGLAILSHCIHLPHSYIDEDTLVAVKMLLETDPKQFLEIANTSRLAHSPIGITVPAIPQEMADRTAALSDGFDAVNERFRQLSVAAAAARDSARLLGRTFEETNDIIRATVDVQGARIANAASYGDYAREFEYQIVAEETGGLVLPQAARQQHAARLAGHAEDIAGILVA